MFVGGLFAGLLASWMVEGKSDGSAAWEVSGSSRAEGSRFSVLRPAAEDAMIIRYPSGQQADKTLESGGRWEMNSSRVLQEARR